LNAHEYVGFGISSVRYLLTISTSSAFDPNPKGEVNVSSSTAKVTRGSISMNDDRRSLTVHDTIHVSDDGGAPDNFSDGDLSVRMDRGYPH
jgi:hypothetical protein